MSSTVNIRPELVMNLLDFREPIQRRFFASISHSRHWRLDSTAVYILHAALAFASDNYHCVSTFLNKRDKKTCDILPETYKACKMCKRVYMQHRCKGCGIGRGQTDMPDEGHCRKYKKLRLRRPADCPDYPTRTVVEDVEDFRCCDCEIRKQQGCTIL